MFKKFLLNTDYNTQREEEAIEITINSDGFTLGTESGTKQKTFDAETACSLDTGLEYFSITASFSGELGFNSGYAYYDDGRVEYSFFLYRTNSHTYHLRLRILNYSDSSVQIPAFSVTAKVLLFVDPI